MDPECGIHNCLWLGTSSGYFLNFRAPPTPPGRPPCARKVFNKQCYLSGFVPLPLLQGGPA
eukprot:2173093-Pyramimonas_sp.AAC.1